VTVALCAPSAAQQLTADQRGQIDDAAMAVLNSTGAPSASVAIVRGGEIVYQGAYGDGRIDPKTPANSSMRYAIGSISKHCDSDSAPSGRRQAFAERQGREVVP